jgi:hypothetical protein
MHLGCFFLGLGCAQLGCRMLIHSAQVVVFVVEAGWAGRLEEGAGQPCRSPLHPHPPLHQHFHPWPQGPGRAGGGGPGAQARRPAAAAAAARLERMAGALGPAARPAVGRGRQVRRQSAVSEGSITWGVWRLWSGEIPRWDFERTMRISEVARKGSMEEAGSRKEEAVSRNGSIKRDNSEQASEQASGQASGRPLNRLPPSTHFLGRL